MRWTSARTGCISRCAADLASLDLNMIRRLSLQVLRQKGVPRDVEEAYRTSPPCVLWCFFGLVWLCLARVWTLCASAVGSSAMPTPVSLPDDPPWWPQTLDMSRGAEETGTAEQPTKQDRPSNESHLAGGVVFGSKMRV